MPVDAQFQKRLISLTEDSDLKRVDLAKASGVDYRALSSALVYGIIPTSKTLIKLANYFDVSIPYLLARTDKNDFIKSTNPSDFQQRFSELCKDKNVSFYKVAKDCFFDKSNIHGWQVKGYIPSIEILDILSSYFKVSLDYLLGRSDYKL